MKLKSLHIFAGSIVSLSIAMVIVGSNVLENVDLVHSAISLVVQAESPTVDEVFVPLGLLLLGMVTDVVRTRRRRQNEILAERLRVLQATMLTVQDIVNNFLNNARLLRFEAEEATISPDTLVLFDAALNATAEKIRVLSELEEVREVRMAAGMGIGFADPTALTAADRFA